ncbi:hypothetical protein W97_08940 [Coniosporium apollinis CBS 100218]|uniref:Uncharacterized protein n=1 Tax=Coniosporium apollinis (strain CBS 100218) TaxID=1168221 RepID=R7Z6N3_CONA1|nr:uncharacterized protein W97_08940 [Coniosporium apollinis CBS 100218]EON69659.1 hypothetical protein W97_08940 [Coniosporium apollinis CBS 100218]
MSESRFLTELLPELALHYRREALKEPEEKCPWLKPFRSAQPDLNEARDHFFKDGSDCINDLEKHTELVRLAAANEELTDEFGLLYIIFMAELYKDVESLTGLKDSGPEVYYDASAVGAHEIERKRNVIRERSKLGSLVDSFLDAGKEMHVKHLARDLGYI